MYAEVAEKMWRWVNRILKDSLIPSGLVWISKLGVVLGVYHRKVPYPHGRLQAKP